MILQSFPDLQNPKQYDLGANYLDKQNYRKIPIEVERHGFDANIMEGNNSRKRHMQANK